MATVTRQPFAPLNGARLQNLTSLKNRQNAISSTSGAKRKAVDIIGTDDSENVDPSFTKRSKGTGNLFSTDILKPTAYVLKASSAPVKDVQPLSSPTRPTASPRRAVLQPHSPASKINTSITKSSPLSAPAGRSPTRGKRSGILSSRRRTAGPYTRVDPPLFNLSAAAPFSLDAALKGTIPSYAARSATPRTASRQSTVKDLNEPDMKASWFFDIHEDTPEQEMTNLLQHGTCVLDISSDEESEQKATRERAEGRDKENVPPVDDVSQTTSRRSARAVNEDEMIVEKERIALGEMDVTTFYAAGCDESSVIIVPADEEEAETEVEDDDEQPTTSAFEFRSELTLVPQEPQELQEPPAQELFVDSKETVDELMGKTDEPAAKAAVLEPMEGTGESFDLWESSSSKDEGEAASAAS